MTRVLVSSESAIMRAGLETVLRDGVGLEVAASVEPEDLASALPGANADTVLLMLEQHQEELPGDVTAVAAEVAVILLVPEPQPALVAEALRAGVRSVMAFRS